ncbi:amidohydrolase [Marinithermofilum abyssi]|uniref:Amidohydrolase n=1 Tax=Marinithermofilum abyssi TaxID=1571185 RepID=A0A8J2VDL9_9BACL|nr:M20 family metallopeptidase [Marinithermofilum abyssi]GGE13674.1 amidohydrolase [Marinithermofilum abyssi]
MNEVIVVAAKKQVMAAKAEALHLQLIAWRRHLHAYPELSFREFETAKFVAEELRRIPGMQVETGVGVTGVVGTLSRGTGPVIAIRADMDALPITEASETPYRSRNPGVMHACGHDAHTAILLGTAHLLGEVFAEGAVEGTVKFLFQPAEEYTGPDGMTGAPRMIEDGALDGVDAVMALHMNPELPVGAVRVHEGYTMAGVGTFHGTLYGTGGHGAAPHLGTDPTWMLIPVLEAIHGIVPRRISPLEPAVVSIGQIHAGTASNVIPAEVFIQGTIRSFHPEVRERIFQELERAFGLAVSLGGNYTFQVDRGEPVLHNDPDVNRRIVETIRSLYPECSLHWGPFGMAAEDFSHMTEQVPGAMFFLGCAKKDGVRRELHTPIFDIDEDCLPMGAAIFAETALRFLRFRADGRERI